MTAINTSTVYADLADHSRRCDTCQAGLMLAVVTVRLVGGQRFPTELCGRGESLLARVMDRRRFRRRGLL